MYLCSNHDQSHTPFLELFTQDAQAKEFEESSSADPSPDQPSSDLATSANAEARKASSEPIKPSPEKDIFVTKLADQVTSAKKDLDREKER